MPEILDITALCPACEEPHTVGRVASGGGNTYIPDATVTCHCGTVYIVTAAMLSGSLQPIYTFPVPVAGGDAGGLDALLL